MLCHCEIVDSAIVVSKYGKGLTLLLGILFYFLLNPYSEWQHSMWSASSTAIYNTKKKKKPKQITWKLWWSACLCWWTTANFFQRKNSFNCIKNQSERIHYRHIKIYKTVSLDGRKEIKMNPVFKELNRSVHTVLLFESCIKNIVGASRLATEA